MNIGLVLSGGGARGIAHLGALQAIEELGVTPSIISGASSGALIGALYSSGKSPTQIMRLIKHYAHSGILAALFFPGGLFSVKGISSLLRENIPVNEFSSLHIALQVTATDLISGVPVCFASGKLHEVLLGSSALPGIFEPIAFDQYLLADGGIMDNLPVRGLIKHCDRIIGIHINKLAINKGQKWNRLEVLERSCILAIEKSTAQNAALCDVFIEPEIPGCSIFDVNQAEKLFDIGYRSVFAQKERIQNLCLPGD